MDLHRFGREDVPVLTRVQIQLNVISALVIRQLVATYGRGNLGFLWLIVEPIFLVTGVIVVWSLINPGGNKHGLSLATFVLSGYIPLTLWRHLSSVPRLMWVNSGLLYHRRITVFDIIIARALTEIAAVSAAGIAVYLMLLSLDLVELIQDPSLVIAGWAFMCWFSLGVGCLTAGLSEKSDLIENLIQPIQYLILPISGVFFMVSWLPKTAQELALFVPLVHIHEMLRAGFFGRAVQTHYSAPYIAIWCIVATVLGLWSVASSRKTMSMR